MHLEFIVDQTAKYSNWLVKGLAGSKTPSEPSLQSIASHDGTVPVKKIHHYCTDYNIEVYYSLSNVSAKGTMYTTYRIVRLKAHGQSALHQL